MSRPESITLVPRLKKRDRAGHKGTYGRVLVVAGSRGMAGSAILCGRAALRGGAGLVQVATASEIEPIVAAGEPCYLTASYDSGERPSFNQTADVLAIGPGLGNTPTTAKLVRDLIAVNPSAAVVLDADALNSLSPWTGEVPKRPWILTPHPLEFARLCGSDVAPKTEEERFEQALAFADRFGVVLVLKGAGTLVTDGRRMYRNTTGNSGMATGGSGDVLTGLIAALIAQKLDPFNAAVLGTWVHGRAGDRAAERMSEAGMIASDFIIDLPAALREVTE